MLRFSATAFLYIMLFSVRPSWGQTDLSKLPGYDSYQRVSQAVRDTASEGRVSGVKWSRDGESMTFTRNGKQYAISLRDLTIEQYKPSEEPEAQSEPRSGRSGRTPAAAAGRS